MRISISAMCSIKRATCGLLLAMLVPAITMADWNVDFSRRFQKATETDIDQAGAASRQPASVGNSGEDHSESASTAGPPVVVPAVEHSADHEELPETPKSKSLLGAFLDSGEPVQDMVILHTEHGFVPSTVHMRKNGRYRVSVVNVDEKEKNVSFILEAFSEHHATYYGKIQTFTVEPKKEGSFSFESPETAAAGKLIVFTPQVTTRTPASLLEEEK